MIIKPANFGLIVLSGVSDGSGLSLLTEPSRILGKQITIKKIWSELTDSNGNKISVGYPSGPTLVFSDITDTYFNLSINGNDVFVNEAPALFSFDNLFLTIKERFSDIKANAKILSSGNAFDIKIFLECYFDLFTNDKIM